MKSDELMLSGELPRPKPDKLIFRVVSADEHDWDVICWKLAKERNCFAVISVVNSHEIFFTELCHYHDYQMKESDGKVLFAPVLISN